jgi:hypothetical protein
MKTLIGVCLIAVICSGCEGFGGGGEQTTNITAENGSTIVIDSEGNEINTQSKNKDESKGAFIPTAEEDYAIHNPKAGL